MVDESTLRKILFDIVAEARDNRQTNGSELLSRLRKWMEPRRVLCEIKNPWDSSGEYALLEKIEQALRGGSIFEAAAQAGMLLPLLQSHI